MKNEGAAVAVVIGIWSLYVIVCLTLTAGIVWAAFHFISKYW